MRRLKIAKMQNRHGLETTLRSRTFIQCKGLSTNRRDSPLSDAQHRPFQRMPVQPGKKPAGQFVDGVVQRHLAGAAGEFAKTIAAFGGHFHVPAAAFDIDIQ